VKTGRAIEKLFWWDGDEDPILPEEAAPSASGAGTERSPTARR
jgi:hypothetical protein